MNEIFAVCIVRWKVCRYSSGRVQNLRRILFVSLSGGGVSSEEVWLRNVRSEWSLVIVMILMGRKDMFDTRGFFQVLLHLIAGIQYDSQLGLLLISSHFILCTMLNTAFYPPTPNSWHPAQHMTWHSRWRNTCNGALRYGNLPEMAQRFGKLVVGGISYFVQSLLKELPELLLRSSARNLVPSAVVVSESKKWSVSMSTLTRLLWDIKLLVVGMCSRR